MPTEGNTIVPPRADAMKVNISNSSGMSLSPLVVIMGIGIAIAVIFLIQYSIGNLQTTLNPDAAGSYFFSGNVSGESLNLALNGLITVPLFILSLFLFLRYYKMKVNDPYRISTTSVFAGMVCNITVTTISIVSLLNDFSHTFTVYLISILAILCFVFAIIKIQEVRNKKISDE